MENRRFLEFILQKGWFSAVPYLVQQGNAPSCNSDIGMGVASLGSEMDALPNGAKPRDVGLCSAEIQGAKVSRNWPKSLAVVTYMAHTARAANVLSVNALRKILLHHFVTTFWGSV